VQGADCPAQLVAALANANRYAQDVEPIDVVILARGGGSIEDLWGFNDEQVARAIASSALPVVCGVGHETDFTIADFVADLRAATPSAAAMAITPNRGDLLADLHATRRRLAADALASIDDEARHLRQMAARLQRAHPERVLARSRQRLDEHARVLELGMQRRLERLDDRTRAARLRLDALNPLAVLERGYSIVQQESGQVVLGPEMAAEGERLTVRAAHGRYAVTRAQESASPGDDALS
jgi:exodeoxyribonuclease VII large subunit